MRCRPHTGGSVELGFGTADVANFVGLLNHIRSKVDYMADAVADAGSFQIKPHWGDDDRIGWKDVHIIRWINGRGDSTIWYCEGKPPDIPDGLLGK
jgi:hypothetical protein